MSTYTVIIEAATGHYEIENPDFFQAEYTAALARAGKFVDRVEEVYITVDLDGFDPSLVPATGTPEPGGLDWYTVNELIRRVLASGRQLVGFDLNELLPQDGQHASNFLAAKLVYRIMSMQVASTSGERSAAS